MKDITITVCICTYKREHLKQTLLSLKQQQLSSPITLDFVIIDNDKNASAKAIVESIFDGKGFNFQYQIEPEKNISLARNRSVSLATGDFLFFMDDDEIAEPNLIQALFDALNTHKASLVLGMVKPEFPSGTPQWISNSVFFEKNLPITGTVLKSASTCNLLIHKSCIVNEIGPFDKGYGLTGGGDTELTYRLHRQGHKIITCPEAVVTELIESDRVNLGYLKRRALRGGETYIRSIFHYESTFNKINTIIKSAVLLPVFCLICFLNFPFGKAYYVKWLLKSYSQVGKFRALLSSKKIQIYS